MLVVLPLLCCGTPPDAPLSSRQNKTSKTAHKLMMMGALIVHGGEDDWGRDEEVRMADVLWDSSSALF
jgi:hypothetical protein